MAQSPNRFEIARDRLLAAQNDLDLLNSVCEEQTIKDLFAHPDVGKSWQDWVEKRLAALTPAPAAPTTVEPAPAAPAAELETVTATEAAEPADDLASLLVEHLGTVKEKRRSKLVADAAEKLSEDEGISFTDEVLSEAEIQIGRWPNPTFTGVILYLRRRAVWAELIKEVNDLQIGFLPPDYCRAVVDTALEKGETFLGACELLPALIEQIKKNKWFLPYPNKGAAEVEAKEGRPAQRGGPKSRSK